MPVVRIKSHGRDARATKKQMPRPDYLLIIATILPLLSFTLLVFVGKRMGKPLAGYVATVAIGMSFVLSIWAMWSWGIGGSYMPRGETTPMKFGMNEQPINLPIGWVPAGYAAGQTTSLKVGVYV